MAMNAWRSLWRQESRSIWRQVFVLLTGLALGNPLCGQTGASISGTITDLTGGALAGASVTVKNLETGAVRTIAADEAGRSLAAALVGERLAGRDEKERVNGAVTTGINTAGVH